MPGEKLNRDKFLTVIELGINSSNHCEAALKSLQSFLRAAQKSALSLVFHNKFVLIIF